MVIEREKAAVGGQDVVDADFEEVGSEEAATVERLESAFQNAVAKVEPVAAPDTKSSPVTSAAPKEWHDGLTRRQRQFVVEFCATFNGTKSAIAAGYARGSADVAASRLLSSAKISAAVEMHMAGVGIARLAVLREIANHAFGDVTQIAESKNGKMKVRDFSKLSDEQRRLITRVKADSEGNIVEVSAGLKGAALAKLARALGLDKTGGLSVHVGNNIVVNITEADAAVL